MHANGEEAKLYPYELDADTLRSYCREQRGIEIAANDALHIASPEVYVDDSRRRFIMYFHGMGRSGYQHSGIAESPDGGFEPRDRILFDYNMRHNAVWIEGDTLHVIWSRVGDAPERLLYSQVDLSPRDWNDWVASEGVELMRPTEPWEGSELPVLSSVRGEMDQAANELRDPFVFMDSDGRRYLYYVGSSEKAIGIAQLTR